MVDTNKKLPKHGWDDEEIVPKYGTTYGEQDILGNHKYVYANPAEPEKYSYQKYDVTGSYETLQKDEQKSEIRTILKTGEVRGYTAGNASEHFDGNRDTSGESTNRSTYRGDNSSTARRSINGYPKGKLETVGVYTQSFTLGDKNSPTTTTKHFVGTDGDEVHEHSGNRHEAFEKDYVQAVTGNKLTMVENGDYGLHVQSGNYDAHIQQKGRIYSGNDLLIESGSKITLKVGASTIVITAGSIEMDSPAIFLN
jgi:hypothetical protein